jgi:leucyl-tRNA synthetase
MTDRYDFRVIEPKWQARWEAERTFRSDDDADRPHYYVLEMFPYPSGAGLSVGHCKNYAPADAFCRYKSMKGFEVLHPMGWDAFGQPAENEAIKRRRHPREMVPEYAANYRRTLKLIGASYDWDREINSSEPEYYRWTQWFFLLLYKRGLAYRATAPINWCPACKTGLANEEVKEGRCWRCDSPVVKRPMPQWYFRITAYADRLLAGIDQLDWPGGIKLQQREWIGRSEGADVDFPIIGDSRSIRVFTTRPDTLWGATFMVLAPEHPLVGELTTAECRAAVDAYVQRTMTATEIERMSVDRPKTGVFIGAYARNPVNGAAIPIWIADYVLMGYGTGAIMAVPAHDQRDFEFARKYDIPVELVYVMDGGPQTGDEMVAALPEGGVMRDFEPSPEALTPKSPFAGSPNTPETVRRVIEWLQQHGVGEGRVNYRLRDWLISRQRYWGAPIPIVHCPSCGEVPVPEDQLPVLLPEVEAYQPSGTGESPLATIPDFVNTRCPACGAPARRETDTMGGFACSSWYFLRFADPHNDTVFADRKKIDAWLPVDMYTGGAEHAVMHLLYARFWTMVMHDAGLVGFDEPFTRLRSQGAMLAYTPGRPPRSDEMTAADEDGDQIVDWIVLRPEELQNFPKDQIIWRWVRMSKSKGNVVTPDAVVAEYGADSLRLFEMFVAPFEDNVRWNPEGVAGCLRFVQRVWRWIMPRIELVKETEARTEIASPRQRQSGLAMTYSAPATASPVAELAQAQVAEVAEATVAEPADATAARLADAPVARLAQAQVAEPADATVARLAEAPVVEPAEAPVARLADAGVAPLSSQLSALSQLSDSDRAVLRKLHQTVRKVGDDIEHFRFNTAIAAIMELVNELYLWLPPDKPVAESAEAPACDPRVVAEAVTKLVLMLAPFAPHVADELWERLGHEGSTYRASWPEWNPAIAAEDSITIAVQVNGKLRDRITVPTSLADAEVQRLALEAPKVAEAIVGKTVRKVISVPGRLVNVVVG